MSATNLLDNITGEYCRQAIVTLGSWFDQDLSPEVSAMREFLPV